MDEDDETFSCPRCANICTGQSCGDYGARPGCGAGVYDAWFRAAERRHYRRMNPRMLVTGAPRQPGITRGTVW